MLEFSLLRPSFKARARTMSSLFASNWHDIFADDVAGAPAITPTLGVDFMRASRPSLSVALRRAGVSLTLAQDLDLGLGGVVWDCGVALAELLDAHPELVRGKRVLELGSGTGVVGIAAAVSETAAHNQLAVELDSILTASSPLTTWCQPLPLLSCISLSKKVLMA